MKAVWAGNSNGRTELAVTADQEQGKIIVLIYGRTTVILVLRLVTFLQKRVTCLRTPFFLYKSGLFKLQRQ